MSKLVRTIRAVKNINQKQLAKQARIPNNFFSAFEQGRYQLSDEEMVRLQAALGVDFEKVQPDFERFLSAIGEK